MKPKHHSQSCGSFLKINVVGQNCVSKLLRQAILVKVLIAQASSSGIMASHKRVLKMSN